MTTPLTRRRLMASGAGALGLATLSSLRIANSAPSRASAVRIVTGLRATTQSIAWIGAEAGVFRKHGVEAVFPKLETGGPESVAGLLRGDWDFAQTGTVPIAEAVLKGGDAVILLRNHEPHNDRFVMTRREITGLNHLEGKKVGILTDAYSGQTGVRTRLAIERTGATAVYLGLGTFENIFAALGHGEIDAGALPIDLRFAGQRQYGWNAFPAGSDVPSILATTRKLIATNRELALNVVRAVVETIFVFKTQPGVVAPLLQRFLHFADLAAAEDLRAFYAPLLPIVPRPNLANGIQHLRTLFSSRYPASAQLQETDIADSSIIDEVERSGFISRLYAGSTEP